MLVPEGHEVVLHQGQDLGVELGVSGKHLQGFIDKSETRKVEKICTFMFYAIRISRTLQNVWVFFWILILICTTKSFM